jgi:hypothetical protein
MIVKRNTNPSDFHPIGHQNWLEVKDVNASFAIGHNGSNIFLLFHVEEPQVRAVNTEFNSSVWEDSCVEFFFSPVGDHYYNFEINAIGTILCAYGPDRHKREHLPESVLQKVIALPSLGRDPIEGISGNIPWSLQVQIPAEVLIFSKIEDFSGMEARGNFYKCGDKLDQPHYLSWEPVLTPNPDFHLPAHFGQLSFQ